MGRNAVSIYDIEVNGLKGDPANLRDYKGKALLIVNVASKCGLTPQYEALQALQEKYEDKGFTVLGFPCNQFFGQEPGTPEEIEEFCSTNFGVSFPLFEKIDVNGPERHELYQILTEVPYSNGEAGDIKWNFEKFVVSPNGHVVARFSPKKTPDDPDVVKTIEEVLPAAEELLQR